jgi:hypothetical protein
MIKLINGLLLFLFLLIRLQSIGQTNDTTKFDVEADTCLLNVQNALSINSDEKRWYVSCNCLVKEFNISVYNRWGEQVYNADSLENFNFVSWDYWNYKKETYIWIIEFKIDYNEQLLNRKKSGSVTLL